MQLYQHRHAQACNSYEETDNSFNNLEEYDEADESDKQDSENTLDHDDNYIEQLYVHMIMFETSGFDFAETSGIDLSSTTEINHLEDDLIYHRGKNKKCCQQAVSINNDLFKYKQAQ